MAVSLKAEKYFPFYYLFNFSVRILSWTGKKPSGNIKTIFSSESKSPQGYILPVKLYEVSMPVSTLSDPSTLVNHTFISSTQLKTSNKNRLVCQVDSHSSEKPLKEYILHFFSSRNELNQAQLYNFKACLHLIFGALHLKLYEGKWFVIKN